MKITKRDLKKIEELKEGKTINVTHRFLSMLSTELTNEEYRNLEIFNGGCYIAK